MKIIVYDLLNQENRNLKNNNQQESKQSVHVLLNLDEQFMLIWIFVHFSMM